MVLDLNWRYLEELMNAHVHTTHMSVLLYTETI